MGERAEWDGMDNGWDEMSNAGRDGRQRRKRRTKTKTRTEMKTEAR